MKTYLVTGGAGFIGSHLCEALLEKGNKVYSIDDLSTGRIENVNILKEKYPDSFIHHTSSIEDAGELIADILEKCDVIYHLAAAVGVKNVVDNPIRTLKTNLRGTEIVLDEAAKKDKRTIIASTSEVYGKAGENGALKETDDLLLGSSYHTRWGYAVSKLADEHLALAYHKEKSLPVTVIRFFNTIGPRQIGTYGMVVPRFVGWALRNEPIQVYGDGKQTRCFCFVGDTINALTGLEDRKEAVGEIFNIGNPKEISMDSLANMIKEKLKSSSEIVHVPYDKAYSKGFEDMKRRVPDISKIKELIGWEPKTSLDETINLISSWMSSD